MDDRSGTWVFIDTFAAWEHVRAHPPDGCLAELSISHDAPDGGTFGEFNLRWYMLANHPVPRLEVWDDGWEALADSGIVGMLAALHAQDDRDEVTVDQVKAALIALGVRDKTAEATT